MLKPFTTDTFFSRAIPTRREAKHSLLVFMSAVAMLGIVTSAQAQGIPTGQADRRADQPSACEVFPIMQAEQQELIANCNGQGVLLGVAEAFEAITNEKTGATLVDVRQPNERRILLISILENGEPQVEDLSAQILDVAHRGPMTRLQDLDLDLARFARTGTIDMEAGTSAFALDQHLARGRERTGRAQLNSEAN